MKIALLGGSFNPPGIHHMRIVEEVMKMHFFDKIIIVPCGPRPDKQSTGDIDPVYRAAMLAITFRGFPEDVEIDMDDLETDLFTRTIELERRYRQMGEVWHIVGYDLVQGGGIGSSPIQRQWTQGNELWKHSGFVVVKRKDFQFNPDDLPPRSIVIQAEIKGSSTEIRRRRFDYHPIDTFVLPAVADYIERYHLYRGRLPAQQTLYKVAPPRLLIVADKNNPKAVAVEEALMPFSCPDDPNLIVDIGGDGNKLRAIREHWRLRLPFFGINTGHRGYLLNDVDASCLLPFKEPLVVHHLPLLTVDVRLTGGQAQQYFAFNDIWVERQTGQSAWLEVIWENENCVSNVIGDGLIVSTAAGSTGYAQNVCGFSMPAYVRELLLVGMAVAEPAGWRNTIFPHNTVIRINVMDSTKRAVRAFVDGIPLGTIERVTIRASRIASVELAFIKGFDIAAKHTKIQLPYFQSMEQSTGSDL